MRTLLFCLSFLISHFSFSEAQTSQVSVAPYWGGRQAALSLTFDDGLEDQYTLAWPELKKRGLRATFAVIGSKVGGIVHSKQDRQDGVSGTPCMTWDMLRTLAADGQEIASHGWEHRGLTRLSAEALRHEVQANDSAIYRETGQWPLTFVYPGNNKSPQVIAFCEQGRVGSRTFQTSFGSWGQAPDPELGQRSCPHDPELGQRSCPHDPELGQCSCPPDPRAYVDTLLTRREWGVTMTHGIARGYDHFADPQVLWAFLDLLVERQDQLWVAPFREVSAYVRERDDVTLTVRQSDPLEGICKLEGICNPRLTVTPSTTLDARLYSQPLTLILHDCHVEQASQTDRPLTVYEHNGRQMVDFNPHGGPIVILLHTNN